MLAPALLAAALLAPTAWIPNPYPDSPTRPEIRECVQGVRAELREHRAHVPPRDVWRGCRNAPNASDVRVFEDGSWWAYTRANVKIVGCLPGRDCND